MFTHKIRFLLWHRLHFDLFVGRLRVRRVKCVYVYYNYIYIYIHTQMFVYICIYIYIYIYTYKHIQYKHILISICHAQHYVITYPNYPTMSSVRRLRLVVVGVVYCHPHSHWRLQGDHCSGYTKTKQWIMCSHNVQSIYITILICIYIHVEFLQNIHITYCHIVHIIDNNGNTCSFRSGSEPDTKVVLL